MKKYNVLFLCTGNSCRSQMAEGLLRARGGERFAVYSAGMEPKEIHPLTHQVMREIGIDTSGQKSKSVQLYLGRLWVHFLVIVCQNAQGSCPRIFPGMVEKFYWPFDDPADFVGDEATTLAKFRAVRDQIDGKIQAWIKELEASGKLDSVVGGQV